MKILLFDIETSPLLANVWSLWSETRDFRFVDVDWYVLSWSAKWLDSNKIMTKALPDYKLYKKDPSNDIELLKDIHALLDEADIVIGHNAQKFDCKKLNTRFIIHGMQPPSPYKIIDTLKVAKANFAFTSNKLDTICRILDIGCKSANHGFDMWRDCLQGKMKAWALMKKYNRNDVVLLEQVYLRLRPYMKTHPNVNLSNDITSKRCSACGSDRLGRRGYSYTNVSKFVRYSCKDCGKWGRDRVNLIDKDDRKDILSNII